jgi:hypothetical protein
MHQEAPHIPSKPLWEKLNSARFVDAGYRHKINDALQHQTGTVLNESDFPKIPNLPEVEIDGIFYEPRSTQGDVGRIQLIELE